MIIKDLFKKDITRPIQGVVTIGNEDEEQKWQNWKSMSALMRSQNHSVHFSAGTANPSITDRKNRRMDHRLLWIR